MIKTLQQARVEMEGCTDSEWINCLESIVRQHEMSWKIIEDGLNVIVERLQANDALEFDEAEIRNT